MKLTTVRQPAARAWSDGNTSAFRPRAAKSSSPAGSSPSPNASASSLPARKNVFPTNLRFVAKKWWNVIASYLPIASDVAFRVMKRVTPMWRFERNAVKMLVTLFVTFSYHHCCGRLSSKSMNINYKPINRNDHKWTPHVCCQNACNSIMNRASRTTPCVLSVTRARLCNYVINPKHFLKFKCINSSKVHSIYVL